MDWGQGNLCSERLPGAVVRPKGGETRRSASPGKRSHELGPWSVIHTMLPPFQVFLDQHREVVYRFLTATVGGDEADDCFQETFLAALRAYPRLREGSNMRAWILKIAERKAVDAHRTSRRRAQPQDRLPERPAPEVHVEADPGLWGAVRVLPPKQRAAVVCRFVNDLPYKEIGTIIGSSEEAARQNVRAGLNKLRREWAG